MILEYLRHGYNVGPQITVNLAANAVNILGPAGDVVYFNPGGFQWFEAGDNVKLKRVKMILPHGLVQGFVFPILRLLYNVDGVGNQNIPELNNDSIFLSSTCGFTDVGVKFTAPTAARYRFILETDGLVGDVSMLGVPALIGAVTTGVAAQLELEHTRPMS